MVAKLDIPQIYAQIDSAIKNDDHEKVLNLAEDILRADAKENQAIECKIIALINLYQNDEIISFIEKNKLQKEYILEYAYSLHEKKRFNESTKFLKENLSSRPDLKLRIDQLIAQNYYKQGLFTESYNIYKEIINSNSYDIEEDKDLISNYLASYIFSKSNEKDYLKSIIKNLNSWESFFNYCIICLKDGNYNESVEILNRMNLEFPNLDDEFNELKLLYLVLNLIQLGFEGIDLSKFTNLLKKYEDYFASGKFSELNVYFYNNFIHFKKDKESLNDIIRKFDTFLKMDSLFEEEKKVILTNKMILLLRANKITEASEVFKILESNSNYKDPKNIIVYLYLIYKNEKIEKLENLLETNEEIRNNPDAHLIYLQILISNWNASTMEIFQKKLLNFVSNFHEYTINYHFLNFFIGFYEQRHQKDNLKDFLNNYKNINNIYEILKSKNHSEFMIKNTLKLIASNFYACGNFEESSKFYSFINSTIDSNDREIKIDLINSLSHISITKAEEIRRKIDETMVDVSMENINNLLNDVFSKFKKNPEKQKKKNKKKNPKRFPKNFDPKNPGPMPDPERWVPKYQRKKYKNIAKNKLSYQGAAIDNTTTISSNKK
jgi:signal recognition particle subunit SRP72